ncbi:hypothetical protein ACMATS_38110 (plasmid) [Streptoverticillium reticulum]|uniref:hypothetical protein n=1 Tax=Streptoverticillium reticulum TaxID=1433415 RepID=UPI0039BF34B0
MARRDEYDEGQAAKRLKVPVTTWRWARHVGLIPEPDVSPVEWSRAAVEALDAGAVRASMPREPLSPYEAANRLAAALGTPNEDGQAPAVSTFAVERLIALGLLLDLSHDHKYPKLSPDQVDAVGTRPDLPEILAREAPLGPEQAAARLGVRRVDYEWMRRLGWITPVSYGRVRFGTSKAGAVTVPRFSTGDVDALPAQHPEVDWEQLRDIGKGRRSPLAALAPAQETATA